MVTTPRRPCAVFWTEHVGSAFSAVPADRQVIRRDPREVSLAPTRTLQHRRCVLERAPRGPAGPDRRFRQACAALQLRGACGADQPRRERALRSRTGTWRPRRCRAAADPCDGPRAHRCFQSAADLRPSLLALRYGRPALPACRQRDQGRRDRCRGHGADRGARRRAGPSLDLRDRRRRLVRYSSYRLLASGRRGVTSIRGAAEPCRRAMHDHLHVGDHRAPKRCAARAPRASRPGVGLSGLSRIHAAARRPDVDASRLGVDRRPGQYPVAGLAARRADDRGAPARIRRRVGAEPARRAWGEERLPAHDGAADDAAVPDPAGHHASLAGHWRGTAGGRAAGGCEIEVRHNVQRVLRADGSRFRDRPVRVTLAGQARLDGAPISRTRRAGPGPGRRAIRDRRGG